MTTRLLEVIAVVSFVIAVAPNWTNAIKCFLFNASKYTYGMPPYVFAFYLVVPVMIGILIYLQLK